MTTSTTHDDLQRRVKQLELENRQLRSEVTRLEASKRFFEEVVNNSQDIIFRKSYRDDGAFEYFNSATIDIVGYTPEEIQSMSQEQFLARVHPDDRDSFLTLINKALTSGGQTVKPAAQYRIKKKDGTYVWLDEKLTIVKDEQGTPDFVVGNVRDISQEKRIKKALQVSENRFTAFMDNIPACAFLEDQHARPLYTNKYLRENLLKGTSNDNDAEALLPVELEARFFSQDVTDLGDGGHEIIETLLDRNGMERVFRTMKFPINRAGKKPLFGGIAVDVTNTVRAEQALKESESKYRTLFEACRETIILTDPFGDMVDINQAGIDLLKYSRDEIIGSNYRKFLSSASREEDFFAEMDIHGYVKDFEDILLKKDGSEINILLSVNAVRDKDGDLYQFQGIIHDITERKRTEEQLKEREAQYRGIFTSIKDALIIFDRQGTIVDVNPQACELYGYTHDELIGMKGDELTHPQFHHLFASFYGDIDTTGSFIGESVDLRKDGATFHVDIKGTKFVYAGAEHVLAIVRDISDRKRADEELKRSRDFLHNIINALDDPVFVKDEEHRWVILNDNACKLIGRPRHELLGKSDTDIYPPYDAEMFLSSDGIVFGTGKTNTHEQNITLEGKIHTISTKKSLFTDSLTGKKYIAGTIRDVTAMKQTEKALRISEERFRTIFEKSPIGIELFDAAGNLLEANEACRDIFGTGGQPLPRNFNILESPEIPDDVKANIAGGKPIRFSTAVDFARIRKLNRYHTKKTAVSHLDVLITPLGAKEKNNPVSYLMHLQDITDQKEAEDALTESERLYRMLAENVSDMISTMNMKMELTYVSPSIVDLIGYTESEVVDLGISGILTEQSYKKALNLFQKELLEQPEMSDGKTRITTADFELTCKDGSVVWAEVKTRFLYDDEGTPSGILGVARDVTERKEAEAQIRSLTKQLLAAQEQERERMARDLHDNLAQQLSLLKIQCHTLFDHIPSDEPELEDKVTAVSERLQATISNVRHLAYNLRPPTLEQFGIVQTVFDYCDEFARAYGIPVDFYSAGMDGLKLDGNIGINIYRIVQEALNNIRKHANADNIKVRLVSSFPNIILRIEDDGEGFDVDTRRREAVIEKRMGLVNIQERAKLLHGSMRIQSQTSKGTQLYMEIPYQEGKNLVD